MNHVDRLRALGACWPAIDWASTQPDAQTAWRNCENPEWLIWLADRIGATHQQIVLAACACVRTALKYIPEEEERPLMAIEAAEAWARGEASLEEVSAARAASRAAVDAALAASLDASVAASRAVCAAVDAALATSRDSAVVYAAVDAALAASRAALAASRDAAVAASRAVDAAVAASLAVDAAVNASRASVDALAASRAVDAARAASRAVVDFALAASRAVAEIDQNNRGACDKIREILPVVCFPPTPTHGLRIVSDSVP